MQYLYFLQVNFHIKNTSIKDVVKMLKLCVFNIGLAFSSKLYYFNNYLIFILNKYTNQNLFCNLLLVYMSYIITIEKDNGKKK